MGDAKTEPLVRMLLDVAPSESRVSERHGAVWVETGSEEDDWMDGAIVVIRESEVELRLPTVDWQGPHCPVRSSKLWRRVSTRDGLDSASLKGLLRRASTAKRRQYKPCRYCGERTPLEHRDGDVCHGCQERELGILH